MWYTASPLFVRRHTGFSVSFLLFFVLIVRLCVQGRSRHAKDRFLRTVVSLTRDEISTVTSTPEPCQCFHIFQYVLLCGLSTSGHFMPAKVTPKLTTSSPLKSQWHSLELSCLYLYNHSDNLKASLESYDPFNIAPCSIHWWIQDGTIDGLSNEQ